MNSEKSPTELIVLFSWRSFWSGWSDKKKLASSNQSHIYFVWSICSLIIRTQNNFFPTQIITKLVEFLKSHFTDNVVSQSQYHLGTFWFVDFGRRAIDTFRWFWRITFRSYTKQTLRNRVLIYFFNCLQILLGFLIF